MKLEMELTQAEMDFVVNAIVDRANSVRYDQRRLTNDRTYLQKCKKERLAIQSVLDKLQKGIK